MSAKYGIDGKLDGVMSGKNPFMNRGPVRRGGGGYGGGNALMSLLSRLDPETARKYLMAWQSGALEDGTPGQSSTRDRANAMRRALAPSEAQQKAQNIQIEMLEEQMRRAKQSPARGGGITRAGGGGAFGAPQPSRSLLNDMMDPNTKKRIREQRDEDRIFEKKARDLELQRLEQAIEESKANAGLVRDKYEFEKMLREKEEGRDANTFSTKRRSLLEMFT